MWTSSKAYDKIDNDLVVVKAYTNRYRGKGGVKLAKDTVDMRKHTAKHIGHGHKGYTVDRILLAKAEILKLNNM